MARRPIGWFVAVAAATAIAGCGGGGEEGGVADVANQTCEEVSAAAKTLSTDLVRGPGKDEAAAVQAAIDRYATTVEAAAKQLQAAKPGKAERTFQQQAVAYLEAQAKDLRAAADGGGADQAAKAAAAAPLVPPAVLDGAPACESAAR